MVVTALVCRGAAIAFLLFAVAARSNCPASLRLFFRHLTPFDSLNLLLEIALEAAVRLDAKRGVLFFGQLLDNLGGDGPGVGQHFVFVERQERVKVGHLIGHTHRDLPGCLILGIIMER
jgi:hypothetical protein